MPAVAAATCLTFGSLKFVFFSILKLLVGRTRASPFLIGTNHHLVVSTRNIHHSFIETKLTEGKDMAHQSHFNLHTVNRHICNSCKQYNNYNFTVLIYLSYNVNIFK